MFTNNIFKILMNLDLYEHPASGLHWAVLIPPFPSGIDHDTVLIEGVYLANHTLKNPFHEDKE